MRRVILLLFALLVSVGLALGQERTVTGVVTDAADGSPLPLAGIRVKGTQHGTVTDNEGRFTLRVSGPDVVLLFEYTGYETQEIPVGDQTTFNVALSVGTEEIGEVLVTAYGTQKRQAITGAIASVDEKKLEKLPGADVGKAMEGQLTGVQISSSSGTPGAGTIIRIRGIGSINASSAPLLIVDGAPYPGSLNTINPADIASYNVLKDAASAALYGARGANGVILITTKSGRKGRTVVNYDGRFGVNMRGIPEYDMVTDPKEYYQLAWKAMRMKLYASAEGGGEPMSLEEAGEEASKGVVDEIGGYYIYKGVDPKEYILPDGSINPALNNAGYIFEDKGWGDWEKALFSPQFRHEHNLSVSKGMDNTQIFFSVSYLDDQGYSTNSYFNRISTRLNVTQQIYEWLRFTNRFSFTRTDMNMQATGGAYVNPFQFMRRLAPMYPIYKHDKDGKVLLDDNGEKRYEDGDAQEGVPKRTSLSNLNLALTQDKDRDGATNYYVNNVGTLDFLLPWNISIQLNLSYNARFGSGIFRQYAFGDAANVNGRLERTRSQNEGINFNQIIDWNWKWDVIEKDALGLELKLGHESFMNRFADLGGGKTNLLYQEITEMNYAAKFEGLWGAGGGYRLEGYFAQASLEFLSRYYFSVSFRMDGSSVFHPDHRWGAFWSVGASWRISQEDFFKDALKYMNNLKLRLSYGLQGNDNLFLPGGGRSYTAYQDLYSVSSDGENMSIANAYKGNEDVTWEKNYNLSTAIEFGFLKNMFSGEFEFFHRKTKDMLFNLPLPAATGFSTYPTNIGDMRNMGIEFTLNVNPVRMDNVSLDINFNITHYKNKILKLPEIYREKGIPSGSMRLMEGHAINEWYLLQYKGPDRNTGLPTYRYYDTTEKKWVVGDHETYGKYVEPSREFTGTTLPDAQGGFGFLLDVYGVDLSAQFAYAFGGKVFDDTYSMLMNAGNRGAGWHTDVRDSWTPENIHATHPRLQWDNRYTESFNDRFLEKATHLAFKSIILGYTLPQKWTQKFYVNRFRIYFVCDNVWLWSVRKGFDPRMYIFSGGGRFTYTPIRTISGGIQLQF